MKEGNSIYIHQWFAKPEDFYFRKCACLGLDLAADCEIAVPINFQ